MSSLRLSEKIAEHISERAAKKNHPKEGENPEDLLTEQEKFKPVNWLGAAARCANQLQRVTHVLKFSHTSAEGSSLAAAQEKKVPDGMQEGGVVSTASLPNPELDFKGDAKYLYVVNFLMIQDENKSLLDFIREGDMSPFVPFAEREGQLEEWRQGFMKILENKELASHSFSKQVYFPIEKGRYHLLSPLQASSFAQEVYKRVSGSRFSDQAKLARKAQKERRYSGDPVVDFHKTAIFSYGGANPQNVSYLNRVRGGKLFLLSCAPPPSWRTELKAPLNIKTVFSAGHFGRLVGEDVLELQEFLERQRKKKSVKPVRDFRKEKVDCLVDQLIQYGESIRALQDASGWSGLPECKLSPAERLWLDPYRRNDETFALEFEAGSWKSQIADQFAHWLNRSLSSKNLHFGDIEHREWKDLAEQSLQRLRNDLEVL